jgi:FkbM family methyltransferase
LYLIQADQDFVDIGANLGMWSNIALDLARNVHAFEPDEALAARLKSTMPRNVLVYPVALSAAEGVSLLRVPLVDGQELTTRATLEPDANVGFREVERLVQLKSLDSFHLMNIGLIKIDVEGHEAKVVAGASETISRERPILIVEIEERHHPGCSAEIIAQITNQGYSCKFIRDDVLHSFSAELLAELQPPGMIPGIGAKHPDYINNFIFLPLERVDLDGVVSSYLRSNAWLKAGLKARRYRPPLFADSPKLSNG